MEVVHLFMEHFPGATEQVNKNGAFKERDNDGDFPLHCACCSAYPPLELVQFLYEQFPNAIKEGNGKGNTPLHHACAGKTGPM